MKIEPSSPAFNPDTATVAEMRDWLAERAGWERYVASNGLIVWHTGSPASNDYFQHHSHPIPATLDAAAEAMPKGWEWEMHNRNVGGLVTIRAIPPTGYWDNAIHASGDTELHARFRLAALCILAEESAHAK